MRYFWLFVVLAFALQSCSRDDGARPEINKDELVDVLFDIHIADGYLSYTGSRIDRNRDRIDGVYEYVLRKHNITPKQFSNTMKYYSRHADEYETLYNKVIEKLTKFETENLNSDETKSLKNNSGRE
ncbi:MAG: DUF4296 domain-containing protein [Salinivirgaceae bacterium]|nr:DUF4296 domain-containing protein [Salinivirgaceae bacterium]